MAFWLPLLIMFAPLLAHPYTLVCHGCTPQIWQQFGASSASLTEWQAHAHEFSHQLNEVRSAFTREQQLHTLYKLLLLRGAEAAALNAEAAAANAKTPKDHWSLIRLQMRGVLKFKGALNRQPSEKSDAHSDSDEEEEEDQRPPKDSDELKEWMEDEFEKIIGMRSLKNQIRNFYGQVRMDAIRRARRQKVSDKSMHFMVRVTPHSLYHPLHRQATRLPSFSNCPCCLGTLPTPR